jgi:hypothetical protein
MSPPPSSRRCELSPLVIGGLVWYTGGSACWGVCVCVCEVCMPRAGQAGSAAASQGRHPFAPHLRPPCRLENSNRSLAVFSLQTFHVTSHTNHASIFTLLSLTTQDIVTFSQRRHGPIPVSMPTRMPFAAPQAADEKIIDTASIPSQHRNTAVADPKRLKP